MPLVGSIFALTLKVTVFPFFVLILFGCFVMTICATSEGAPPSGSSRGISPIIISPIMAPFPPPQVSITFPPGAEVHSPGSTISYPKISPSSVKTALNNPPVPVPP